MKKYAKKIKLLIATTVTLIVVVFGISYYSLMSILTPPPYADGQEKVIGIRNHLIEKYGAQEVSFVTEDGIRLAGLLIERDKPRGNMIVCHGFQSYKEKVRRFARLFPEMNMLFFDFRGHGQSDGDLVTIGYKEYRDVAAASHFMREQLGTTLPLIILGVSMGGASVLHAAYRDDSICDALIIDSSFASLWGVITDVFSRYSGLPTFPFLPAMEMMLNVIYTIDLRMVRPVDYVRTIKKPMLFIHSTYDSHTTPFDTLQIYAGADPSLAKVWIGPKTKHAYLHKSYAAKYAQKVIRFLEKSGVLK